MDKESSHSLNTETKILQAAEKEFFEKGYAGARTASIAEAAGVTHAMLHYYFRTKQGVERHFDFISAHRDLPKFIVNEVLARPEHIEMMRQNARHIVNSLVDNLQREIDDYAAQGLCRRVDARMLLIDIISLNVFPFMAAPIVSGAIGDSYGSYEEFLAMRKKENLETILNKLKIR